MNLYDIDAKIMECVDIETGEIINEDALDALTMERDAKVENIALWIKNLKAEAEALKAEKDAFAKRQKTAENKMNSLKQYLSGYLDGTKFETAKCKVSFRKSEYVYVSEEADIPDEYLKFKEPDVDKTKLKAALKAGTTVSGCCIETRQNIQIA